MAEIKHSRPPNFADIVAVFPGARGPGVIFAHAPFIYVPNGKPLPPELIAHENIHIKRQKLMGVQAWWEKYLADAQFRWDEELLAHRAEFNSAASQTRTHKQRQVVLRTVAKKLAAPLYGRMASTDDCMKLLGG